MVQKSISITASDAHGWKTTESSYKSIATKILKKRVDLDVGVAQASNWSFQVNDINKYLELEGIVCTVCQEGFETGDFVSRMPCGHFFHESCIAEWFKIRNSIPEYSEIDWEWSFDNYYWHSDSDSASDSEENDQSSDFDSESDSKLGSEKVATPDPELNSELVS